MRFTATVFVPGLFLAVISAAIAEDRPGPPPAPGQAAEGIRDLIISPDGPLYLLPPALLFPGRVVTIVPSATTRCLLRESATPRGKGVLALGGVDYEPLGQPPLPGSRVEAERAGTVVLTGKRASREELVKALARPERWRALHFACHASANAAHPHLSALFLAPDASGESRLSVLDVFSMRLPADLAVLSACETARGTVYRAEGIVGLTRAFMTAGIPRVICSLWRVDDQATTALMVKFHELWIPSRGGGLLAARALREAQEFVRGHDKWSHPYYWAAWVLWGLPD